MKSRRKRVRREILEGKRMLDVAHEASVVLDAILEHRIHAAPESALRAECRRLMKVALTLHQANFTRRWKHLNSHGWTGKLGLYMKWGVGEHHYMCGFCHENLESRSNGPKGGAKIMEPTMRRLEAHGWACGMRYLMERGGLGGPLGSA